MSEYKEDFLHRPALSFVGAQAALDMTVSDTHVQSIYREPWNTSSDSCTGKSRLVDPTLAVVVYHHVATTEHLFTNGLNVRTHPETFRRHLAYYARNYDIISQEDLIEARLPRRPLLITFDDLYRSVLDVAGPLLRDINAPSLLFLNSSFLLGPHVPMDNLIAYAMTEMGARLVQELLNVHFSEVAKASQVIERGLSILDSAQISEAREVLISALGTTELELRRAGSMFLGAEDVLSLAQYGIEVGNHSMSHRFFRSLTATELTAEIAGGRKALEVLLSKPVQALSIPYGNERDATDEALGIARSSGHKAIFLVHGRSNRRRPAPDLYYRASLTRSSAFMLPLMLAALPRLRSYFTRRQPWVYQAMNVKPDGT